MLQKKTKVTNKKFYDKWLYKVSLTFEGANVFRMRSYDQITDLFQSEPTVGRSYSVALKAWKEKDHILEMIGFLGSISQSILWSKRIERNQFDFYTNDKDLYESFSNTFAEKLLHRFEPNEACLDNLDNSHTIVAKKLPHNRFNFKVYLLPHKLKGDKETKKNFVSWLKTQTPRITCSTAVEKWFIATDWNWDRRYVLVEDESTLLMMKLKNSEVVGKIYKYQVYDK